MEFKDVASSYWLSSSLQIRPVHRLTQGCLFIPLSVKETEDFAKTAKILAPQPTNLPKPIKQRDIPIVFATSQFSYKHLNLAFKEIS